MYNQQRKLEIKHATETSEHLKLTSVREHINMSTPQQRRAIHLLYLTSQVMYEYDIKELTRFNDEVKVIEMDAFYN